MKLDTRESRNDLTSKEFAKIISGLLGGLINLGEIKDLRNAMEWILYSNGIWAALEYLKKNGNQLTSQILNESKEKSSGGTTA